MPAYHTSAGQTLHAFDAGFQRVAGGVADIMIATAEAHRADAAAARVLLAEAARVRAGRLALAARREAETAERDRVAGLRAAALRRQFAARHA